MSSGFKFELNRDGVAELLHSAGMEAALLKAAKKVATNAGTGYEAKQMGTRVIAVPVTQKAEQDNYDNNTLLKSMG